MNNEKLIELIKQIPPNIQADWDGTNHYELQDVACCGDYFWLDIADVFAGKSRDFSSTPEGKRLGLILDFVCEARAYFEKNPPVDPWKPIEDAPLQKEVKIKCKDNDRVLVTYITFHTKEHALEMKRNGWTHFMEV